MRHKVLVAFLVMAVVLLGAQAFAAPARVAALAADIEVAQGSFTLADEVAVTFSLTNTGDEAISVLRWETPLRGLTNDLFVVTRNGERVPYIGRLVKWAAPTDDDYILIEPGQTVSAVIDLSSAYDMSATGNYSVRFRAFMRHDPTPDVPPADAPTEEAGFVTSRPVHFFVEGREPWVQLPEEEIDFGVAGIGGYTSCTNTQKSALQTAHSNALTISTKGYNNLVNYPSGSTLYKTWFGTYTSSRFSTVKSHFTKIKGAFASKTFYYDCSCTENAYAYVYPNQPYKVYLCRAFWSAPALGRDSKAGTLVHETSHFTVVAGTQDYVYGESGAKNLAKTNPSKAVMNADNHEYFAEDAP